MELYTNTLMEDSQQLIKVEAAYSWMKIIDYKIKQDVYGLTGWIRWHTDRQPETKEISSIHLDQHPYFKKMFRWKI